MPQVTFKRWMAEDVYNTIRRAEAKLELIDVMNAEGPTEREGFQAVIEDCSKELRELWLDIELDGQKEAEAE